MFGKKKDPIKFISIVNGLDEIEECVPKPSKKYMPDWWKDIPFYNDGEVTVKACPSFPDFFSQGYVIPMWMDVIFSYNKSMDVWSVHSKQEIMKISAHSNGQFIDYTTPKMKGKEGSFVFKANSPWKIITPPGYSVLQIPMFYHFNQDFSVLPGIVDTDISHDVNQQIVYYGSGEEVTIPRGTPLAMYIPFKRDKHKHIVKSADNKDIDLFYKQSLNFATKNTGSGVYREMQRQRDKKNK